MRTRLIGALAILLLGGSSVVWAKCPDGHVLKQIGSARTADAVISTTGQDVQAIAVLCAGTACVAGFYNVDTLGTAVVADLVIEAGAAASTLAGGGLIDLTDSPLYFSEGVTLVMDANVSAVTVFSCQPR